VKLVLRPHPNDQSFVACLDPFLLNHPQAIILESSFDDVEIYSALLAQSACAISSGGSVSVEASLLGIPSLTIGFSLDEADNRRLKNRYELDHLREAAELKYFEICYSLEALTIAIEAAINGSNTPRLSETSEDRLISPRELDCNGMFRKFILGN
jgi:hypothetical protein